MKTCGVISVLVLVQAGMAWGNEGFVHWSGGTVCPCPESETIQLESEEVDIALEDDAYTVDAKFTFQNSGAAATVTMGFPVSSGGVLFRDGLLEERGDVLSFQTWVNDKEVEFKKASCSLWYYDTKTREEKTLREPGEIDDFKKRLSAGLLDGVTQIHEHVWFVKNVSFEVGKPLTTRVRYRSKYNPTSSGLYFDASYVYGSGRAWKGVIKQATFTITTMPKVWMVNCPRVEHAHQWMRDGEYTYVLRMADLEPEEHDELAPTLSKTNPPYVCDGGILIPNYIVTDTDLSLCNRQLVKEFPSYVAETRRLVEEEQPSAGDEGDKDPWAPFRKTQEQNCRHADEYLRWAKKRDFRYPVVDFTE